MKTFPKCDPCLRVSFTRYSQQEVLLTHPNKFPFSQAKGVISTSRMGWFSRALTCFPACFARSNIHIKNYSAIARRKNIPFYPARTGINFSYFQLARRSFRFPSQLISQCFFFQLAQILPDERVFCRAAPSGTPDFTFLLVDFGKVLCSSANEHQLNSNASCREDYIPQILAVLLQIHRVYI